MTSVGVVGMGFVGGAVFKGLQPCAEVRGYDIDPKRATHSFEDVVASDFVFVCLPTPMETVEGGKADICYIEDFFKQVQNNKKTIFIIKSTIPVGTTRYLTQEYGVRLVHSPEFLTEKNAMVDFITPTRHVVGGLDDEANLAVEELYKSRFSMTPVFVMGPEEAELVKYMANCFLATKVLFFNEMYLLAEKLGLEWQDIMNGVLSDGRIAKAHTNVPGHDGDKGFGGKCFPKDLNALIAVFEDHNLNPLQLKATWEQNKAIRKNWDWAKIKGAVKE